MIVLAHGVHHIHPDPESWVTEQVYYVHHYGFGCKNLVQIAVVRLYCASDPSRMFRGGILTLIIFLQLTLNTRGTVAMSFDNHPTYFLFYECYNVGQ